MNHVIVEESSENWAGHGPFYAQRFIAGVPQLFGFGATETEALAALLAAEAADERTSPQGRNT